MKQDPNYIAKLEKAIKEKYGEEAIVNPKSLWSEDKEKEYLQQLKDSSKKHLQKPERIEINGINVSKNLFRERQSNRVCPECETYSFDSKDDVYMSKFKCCFKCYVTNIEGR